MTPTADTFLADLVAFVLLYLWIYLFVVAVWALIPAAIAASKGRNFFLWWIYGVMLHLIATIHAIVIHRKVPCPHCGDMIEEHLLLNHIHAYHWAALMRRADPALEPVRYVIPY